MGGQVYRLHFMDEKTESQRRAVICSSPWVTEDTQQHRVKLDREPRNVAGTTLGLWGGNKEGLGQNHDSTAPETSLPLRGGSAPTPTLLEAPNSQNPAISRAIPAPGAWVSTPLLNPRSSVSLLPSFLTWGKHVPARSLCLPLEVPLASPVPLPPPTCRCQG